MKKKIQWKDFLMLQVVFLIYSFTSLTQKLASSFLPKDAGTTEELVRQLLNWKLILSAGLVVLLLGVYALLWQQVIKRFELSVAYANKAITLLWALVWGIFIFHEEITPGKVIGILLVMDLRAEHGRTSENGGSPGRRASGNRRTAGNSRSPENSRTSGNSRKGERRMNIYLIILIVSVMIASFAQVLLKKSAEKTYASPLREYLNLYVICGYGLMFLSMFMTIASYSGLDFTNVPVIESLGYVMVMFLSYFFFKEKITKRKLFGMVIILVGIFIYHR